jgi:hypothetical protein
MKSSSYSEVRSQMKPGDVIAFAGKDNFSDVIKWATRSNVSHVGVVFETKVMFEDEAQPGVIVDVMESTTLYVDPVTGKRTSGVQRSRLSDRIKYHNGQIWWLPLSDRSRQNLDLKKFADFMLHHDKREYDLPQAILAGVDTLDKLGVTKNTEDFAKFFCSELVAAALEASGVIGKINASEVTPIDLCCFSLFEDDYYLLTGETLEINGFNTRSPENFGF